MKPTILLLLALCLSACLPEQPTLTPSPIPFMCAGFMQISGSRFSCTMETASITILQTMPEQQVVLQNDVITLTFRGTTALNQLDNAGIIAVIDGNAVITNRRYTRIIQAGSQINFNMNPSSDFGEITDLEANLFGNSVFNNLVQPTLPTLLPNSTTAGIDQTPATVVATCQPRSDWQDTYIVQSGDVLNIIVRQYGITLIEMAEGNCLENPDRLRIGQVLRVPSTIGSNTPTWTPSAIAFRADSEVITAGTCTTLRWDVFNVSAVFLDNEATTSNNIRSVCPTATTVYILRIVYPDNQISEREVTIIVNP